MILMIFNHLTLTNFCLFSFFSLYVFYLDKQNIVVNDNILYIFILSQVCTILTHILEILKILTTQWPSLNEPYTYLCFLSFMIHSPILESCGNVCAMEAQFSKALKSGVSQIDQKP